MEVSNNSICLIKYHWHIEFFLRAKRTRFKIVLSEFWFIILIPGLNNKKQVFEPLFIVAWHVNSNGINEMFIVIMNIILHVISIIHRKFTMAEIIHSVYGIFLHIQNWCLQECTHFWNLLINLLVILCSK